MRWAQNELKSVLRQQEPIPILLREKNTTSLNSFHIQKT